MAEYTFGCLGEGEFRRGALYRSVIQAFFLACEGGTRSYHARIVRCGVTSTGEDVIPMSELEAICWLEEHEQTDCLERLFDPFPEAGDNKQLLFVRIPLEVFKIVKQAAESEEWSIDQWSKSAIGSALRKR